MSGTTCTAEGITRHDLMEGRLRATAIPRRPPWALSEIAFQEICTGCNACIETCQTSILKKARGGYPIVDFTDGECTFCGECVKVCRPRALSRDGGKLPWALMATISQFSCLSATGTMCRTCGDRCDVGAISYQLALKGKATPVVDPALCSGCGACVAPCPVDAVNMISVTTGS